VLPLGRSDHSKGLRGESSGNKTPIVQEPVAADAVVEKVDADKE